MKYTHGKVWYNLQDKLNQSSKENRQLSDEFEQLDSEHAQLHSDFHSLEQEKEQEKESALSKLRSTTAELSLIKQQATAEYDSFRAQSQEEVEFLQSRINEVQRQRQSSFAQVQTLQDQLEKSHTYIAALQNQLGIGKSESKMPLGHEMKSPRPVRTTSLTGSMRSPKSPGGSSTSSGTSSRARNDIQVRTTSQSVCATFVASVPMHPSISNSLASHGAFFYFPVSCSSCLPPVVWSTILQPFKNVRTHSTVASVESFNF